MKEWPFKEMKEGDVVMIPSDVGLEAQRYAHSYGKATGKRFSTKFELPYLVVRRLGDDEKRPSSRIDHPIWDMRIGDKIRLEKYQYTTMDQDKFAYKVAARTGRKFSCSRVKGMLCTWDIERIK